MLEEDIRNEKGSENDVSPAPNSHSEHFAPPVDDQSTGKDDVSTGLDFGVTKFYV